ncbi:hypothetical protein [Streptacidiphilus sp. PAMC 29251]
MQSCHAATAVSAVFDEPNLIADAGLLSLVRLAERAGLRQLAARPRSASRAPTTAAEPTRPPK